MLKTAHDEALFEYYFTSQLAAINTTTGAKTPFGQPAIFANVTPSPSGDYVLVTTIKRPFSHLIPMNGFPQDVEIWARTGRRAKKIADVPTREGDAAHRRRDRAARASLARRISRRPSSGSKRSTAAI